MQTGKVSTSVEKGTKPAYSIEDAKRDLKLSGPNGSVMSTTISTAVQPKKLKKS